MKKRILSILLTLCMVLCLMPTAAFAEGNEDTPMQALTNVAITFPAPKAGENITEAMKAASANVNTFVEKAKQYTAIDELTPELLRLFIQRIEVGERTEKYSRSSHQSIRIVYRDIGTVDSAMEQGEAQPRIAPPLSEVFELPA